MGGGGIKTSVLCLTKHSPCTCEESSKLLSTYISHIILPTTRSNTYIFLFLRKIKNHTERLTFLRSHSQQVIERRYTLRGFPRKPTPFLHKTLELTECLAGELTDMKGIWVSSILCYQPLSEMYENQPICICAETSVNNG